MQASDLSGEVSRAFRELFEEGEWEGEGEVKL